jgi:hypothetical protein
MKGRWVMFEPVLNAIDQALETLKALKDAKAHPPDLLRHFKPRWKCYPKPEHEAAHHLLRGMLALCSRGGP